MHSSIQFRHEATSAYGLRRLRVSDCSEETHFLQTVICAGDFSLWGEICEWKLVTGSWTLGSSSVLGLDRVSLVVLLRMVRLLQLVSQTVTLSPVCHREARSPTRNGTEMIWITLICLLLRGGPWGWMCRSGLGGPLCGPVGGHRSPQTLSPPPSS